MKENTRAFSQNPYEFIKKNITRADQSVPKSPSCTAEDANTFFAERYTDPSRSALFSYPSFLNMPMSPKHRFPLSPPTDDEIYDYVRSRRHKAAPGTDGITFMVFKKCKVIRTVLARLVRRVFAQSCVPQSDCIAIKILLHKGSQSDDLPEFRDLTLFNTTLKTIFGVWSRRVRTFY